MSTLSFRIQSEDLIRKTGTRPTAIRTRVLACLMSQPCAVTHHQIELALAKLERVDKVTLYRTLNWLVEQGLAHKVLGEDRTWHFHANTEDSVHHQHAHFKCLHCEKMICLNTLPTIPRLPALPKGYRGVEVEVTIKGLCVNCN